MIAPAAPSSHVRLKRLCERPSPQDGAGGYCSINSRGAPTQNKFCHRSLKDIAPNKNRRLSHEHTGSQRPLRLGSVRVTSGGTVIYGRSLTSPRSEFSFTINVNRPFWLDLTVWALRRRSINETDRWDGAAYRRTIHAGELLWDLR